MSVPRKWLKWGIGTGATLTAALLFQIVKQNDVFLHAVATNQDRALSQTDQLYQRDATNPYRSQHQSLPTETIPETDTVQPFFFTFPQEPATSREKTPQARTQPLLSHLTRKIMAIKKQKCTIGKTKKTWMRKANGINTKWTETNGIKANTKTTGTKKMAGDKTKMIGSFRAMIDKVALRPMQTCRSQSMLKRWYHELHNNDMSGSFVNVRRNENQSFRNGITDDAPFPGDEHRD